MQLSNSVTIHILYSNEIAISIDLVPNFRLLV